MENAKLNNDSIDSLSDLKDYEIKTPDKKNLFSSFLNIFKNKNQKLLDSGNHTKTTTRSISSMWRMGNLRTSLFNSIENIRKSISGKFSKTEIRNKITPEIYVEENLEVGENKETPKDTVKNLQDTPFVIPPYENNTKPQTIIQSTPTIKIENIDTSAIEEKKQKKEDAPLVEEKTSDTKKVKFETPSISDNSSYWDR